MHLKPVKILMERLAPDNKVNSGKKGDKNVSLHLLSTYKLKDWYLMTS